MVTMVCMYVESVSSMEGGTRGSKRRLRRYRQRSATPSNGRRGKSLGLQFIRSIIRNF
jgi:hypothetical protein